MWGLTKIQNFGPSKYIENGKSQRYIEAFATAKTEATLGSLAPLPEVAGKPH